MNFDDGAFDKCMDRWHDAGTYDAKTKTGGPNGSIRQEKEYSHSANKGLKIAIDLLGEVLLPSSTYVIIVIIINY